MFSAKILKVQQPKAIYQYTYRNDKLYEVSAYSSLKKILLHDGLRGPKLVAEILKNKDYLFIIMSVVICNKYCIKVKQSHYRSGKALRVPEA